MSDLRDQLQADLAERYVIERELGRGGMATVYLAQDLRHDRSVALKVLRPELAQTLLAYGRFRRGDNALEDRAMIERALGLFEEMNATGWVEEARAALGAT